MAKATFDIKKIDLSKIDLPDFEIAGIDLKAEATRGLHAGVGAADLAVEFVKEYVAEVQKRFAGLELEPKALREHATTVFTARVEELSPEAKARRTAIEKRVAELQDEAQKLPSKVQTLVNENVETASGTYGDLVKRGETVVRKFRNQPAAKETVANAKTTVAKAKATKTTATKAAKSVKSSAKATSTSAKNTASSATKAVS